MLNQLATKPTQRLCCQSQCWQQETEIWPLLFPLLKKQFKLLVSQPESATADATLGYCSAESHIPIGTMSLRVWECLCHAPPLASGPGRAVPWGSQAVGPWSPHFALLLQLHPHMTLQCLTLHTTASSCCSDPLPKTFHPSSVKSSPPYLSRTRFMFVFKVHCSWEMHLAHQAGQER